MDVLDKALSIRRGRDAHEQAAATAEAIKSHMDDLRSFTRLAVEEATKEPSPEAIQLQVIEQHQIALMEELARLVTVMQALKVDVPETKVTLEQPPVDVTVNVPESPINIDSPAIEFNPVINPEVVVKDARPRPKSITIDHSDGTQSTVTINY